MDKQKPKLKYCPNAIGAFSGITNDGKKVIAGALRCNDWNCPFCNTPKKKKLTRRILQGAIGEESTSRYAFKFLTLTYGGLEARNFAKQQLKIHNETNKEDLNLKEFIYNIMIKNFHKLIRAIKKKYGHFHYFRVCELHKDGIPHLHVLLAGNAIIPKTVLESIEKLWRDKYAMGFVRLNCMKFRNKKHAISYMLKYITKDIQKVGRWKRIFSASQHSLAKIDKTDWLMVQVYIGKVNDKGILEGMIDDSTILNHSLDPTIPLTDAAMNLMSIFMTSVRYAI